MVPIALASVITLNLPDNCTVETALDNTCSDADYTVIYDPAADVGGVATYAEYYIMSNRAVVVGDTTTGWPTVGIHIGDISSVDNSLFTCTNGDNDCVLGINVYSDAIQTTGFVSAISAFENFTETY